jgi:hypothetical protein
MWPRNYACLVDPLKNTFLNFWTKSKELCLQNIPRKWLFPAVLDFTESREFCSFKLVSQKRCNLVASFCFKASLISLIKIFSQVQCLTRPGRVINEEFPFEIKYTDFVSPCFHVCLPCFLSFHGVSHVTQNGSRTGDRSLGLRQDMDFTGTVRYTLHCPLTRNVLGIEVGAEGRWLLEKKKGPPFLGIFCHKGFTCNIHTTINNK